MWKMTTLATRLALGLSAALPIAAHAQQNTCGAAVKGITLCLTAPSADTLSLLIKNDGSSDETINLGIALANGAHQYATAVVLALTDSRGAEHRGVSSDPAAVAGRLDPLVLALPAGASLRLPLRLSRYAIQTGGHFDGIGLSATEHYAVRAELTGKPVSASDVNLDMKGLSLTRYWTGTATSNPVAVGASSQRGGP